MNVVKLFMVLLLSPIVCFGQNSPYPKDTIYIKFENKIENKKWIGTYGYGKNKKTGVLFNLKDNDKQAMSFFIEKNKTPDTLCITQLKNYKFSDLQEIDEKRYKWVFDHKRPPANRNDIFKTFLIEVISRDKFVIYPVIWRSEGAID